MGCQEVCEHSRLKSLAFETKFNVVGRMIISPLSLSRNTLIWKFRQKNALKKQPYFNNGAQEVWICDLYGKISFYNRSGRLNNSLHAANFPLSLTLFA